MASAPRTGASKVPRTEGETMKSYTLRSFQLPTMALAAACLIALPAIATAQQPKTTYTGEAVVVDVKALGIVNVALEDTGALPSSGGSLSTELLSANIPGLLDVQLLDASTNGANHQTNSAASVANVALSVAGIYVTASVLTSNAAAFCQPGHASASG